MLMFAEACPQQQVRKFSCYAENRIQVKGPQNVGPKRKGPVFLLKSFGIIVFV